MNDFDLLTTAAGYKDVSEMQVICDALEASYGQCDAKLACVVYDSYIRNRILPVWVRHYCRNIVTHHMVQESEDGFSLFLKFTIAFLRRIRILGT